MPAPPRHRPDTASGQDTANDGGTPTNPYPATLKLAETTFTTGHFDLCQHSGR
jgi:hypothetical protein